MNNVNALGFVLRGGSAGAKFLFVLYFASKANSAILGQVALVITIAAVFSQVAGLEINQVVGRQLHALSINERMLLLRRQAQAIVIAYILILPLAILAYADLLADHWISICGILVLEHFILEVYRFNILMMRTVYASILLFIKNAGWVLLFVLLVESDLASPSLQLVLHCWFGVLALIAIPLLINRDAWLTIKEFFTLSTWPAQSAALVWQSRTFIVSALVGIGAIDKLVIADQFPVADLGVYFFFATCASIITLIVSFSIGATVGPQCIKVHATLGRDAYLPHLRRLKRLYLLTTLVTMAMIMLPADYLLTYFGKAEYHSQIEILYFLTLSAALLVLCEPYKINAYVERQDLLLMIGTIVHLVSVVVCVLLFAVKRDVVWISAGVLLSSVLIYLYFALDIGNRVSNHLKPIFARH